MISLNNWFSLRMDLIALAVLIFSVMFCVINRTIADPKLIGMLLIYVISFQESLVWLFKNCAWFESRMVSFDRCVKMTEVVQEAPQIMGTEAAH